MTTRHAACSCEQLRLTVRGEPVRVSICHCLACQRRTGSVFGVQARFDAEQVTIEGASRQYIRVSDDGARCAFHFCPDCGATVFYAPEASPGIVAVPVGAFADPSFPAPTISVWEKRRHSWLRLPDDIEHVSAPARGECLLLTHFRFEDPRCHRGKPPIELQRLAVTLGARQTYRREKGRAVA